MHLRAGAIPTKFDFPAYLFPKTGTKRKLSLKRTAPVCIASVGIPVPECGPSTGDQSLSTVIHDHPYEIQKSPCKLKRELDDALLAVDRYKKKVNVSQQKTSRYRKKVKNLTTVVASLKRNHFVSGDYADVLEKTFSGASEKLMQRRWGVTVWLLAPC